MGDEVIFVGKKPLMTYVLAVLTQFTSGRNEVLVKARGQMISKAVDIVQVAKRRMSPEISIPNIEIGTEELRGKENKTRNVSFISISLKR
jgi:DNA-binding protein